MCRRYLFPLLLALFSLAAASGISAQEATPTISHEQRLELIHNSRSIVSLSGKLGEEVERLLTLSNDWESKHGEALRRAESLQRLLESSQGTVTRLGKQVIEQERTISKLENSPDEISKSLEQERRATDRALRETAIKFGIGGAVTGAVITAILGLFVM